MPPDELWRTPSKSYLSSVMEGGVGRKSSKSGGRAEDLSERRGGQWLLLWTLSSVSKILLEALEDEFLSSEASLPNVFDAVD